MKLQDMLTNNLESLLHECDIAEVKPHARDDGTITAFEIKYVPNDYRQQVGDIKPKSIEEEFGF